MKKKILVVALFYPTPENPYHGSFFKEQIEFLSTEYNITVLKYSECVDGFLIDKKPKYLNSHNDRGIKQYYPIVRISMMRRYCEKIGSFIKKQKSDVTAVGIYRSEGYKKYRRKCTAKIIDDLNLEYDLVYCITAQECVFQALQFSEIKNRPFIVSEHRPYPHPGWSTVDVEKYAFEKADCFFAISKDKIRQIMLQDIKLKRIAYVGNLIDEQKFIVNPRKHEYTTLLIVAAHSYFKNFDMFIETINKLSEITDREFRVIIAGYGANKGYAEDTEKLERKILKSKFADRSELIREVSRDEICDLYNRADALVLTSIQEGQPMVALEAACCGIPIFTTRCGGVEDYVTDEVGRIVDITDSEGLAEYLCEFIEGEIIFDKKVIRKNIVDKYGRDVFMKKIKTEFNRVIVE